MDVGNINHSGGINRNHGSADRAAQKVLKPHVPAHGSVQDKASISQDGKATLARVEELTQRLRNEDDGRSQLVDAARQRLASGALDSFEAYRGAAAGLLSDS